ncbi:NUDIX hydrolase [Clostridium taeniosporum]|uniref:CoA pyrophosphatase n=1 Tax=Clostridium taeniosporum TaxID=394958 RepID=A0A1D7XJT2_9CLOT|nr:CoA pyrophosphatase [Clostridium taeniosporum]AOR23602.1 CoA pyrophosphatase [Clostridium taeniosporum]
MNINEIKEKIEHTIPYINGWNKDKRASIIIPLVNINDDICILFEVRSKKLNAQPGDICFPGGRIDKDETPKQAGIREFYEELGIKDVNIINELDLTIRHDGMIIHSFVGIVNNIDELLINESEVDHIFYVPLQYLLSHAPLESVGKLTVNRASDFPYNLIFNGKNYKFKEGKYVSLFYRYKKYVIWGITANILKNFLDKL